MNIFLYYFITVLLYLGIGQVQRVDLYAFRPINDIQSLAGYINNHPASVVLADISMEGFFFKTYSFDLLVFRPSFRVGRFKIKVSKRMAENYSAYVGISIANTQITDQIRIIYTPLPPGALFIGNASLGRWEINNGVQYWKFFPQFSHLPEEFGWGNFIPNYEFYIGVMENMNRKKPFYGAKQEFGRGLKITEEFLKKYTVSEYKKKWSAKDLFKIYFRWPN